MLVIRRIIRWATERIGQALGSVPIGMDIDIASDASKIAIEPWLAGLLAIERFHDAVASCSRGLRDAIRVIVRAGVQKHGMIEDRVHGVRGISPVNGVVD